MNKFSSIILADLKNELSSQEYIRKWRKEHQYDVIDTSDLVHVIKPDNLLQFYMSSGGLDDVPCFAYNILEVVLKGDVEWTDIFQQLKNEGLLE